MPSPVTVTTGRPRHPREVRERMEGEVMILLTGAQALDRLILDCRFPEATARRLLNIAWEFGQKAEPCPGGYVHIWYHGKDDTDNHVFSVVEHIGNTQIKTVASGSRKRYTQVTEPESTRKGPTMPPRKTRQTAPAPEETASQNGEVDFQKYVEKNLTATMEDYVEWFEANVASLDDLPVDKILTLGVSLYSHFQRSDFNVERREARRAEREATRQDAEDEPEPARPAKGTRARTAPAKAAPATSGRSGGRPARSAGKPANAKPGAKPRSGRRTAAAATADADGGDAPF